MVCRNICQQYVIREPRSSKKCKPNQKKCIICSNFIEWDGLHCPCCNYRLKSAIKIIKEKEELELKLQRRAKRESDAKKRREEKAAKKLLTKVKREQLKKEKLEKLSKRRQELDQLRTESSKNRMEKLKQKQLNTAERRKQESQIIIDDNLIIIRQRIEGLTFKINQRKLNDFQLCELVRQELFTIRREKIRQGYASMQHKKDSISRHTLPRNERSPFFEAGKILGIYSTRIESIVRIMSYGDDELINKVRLSQITITKANHKVQEKRANLTRYNFRTKLLPSKRQSPYRFCPVCGTETLERWFNVKEIHCTNCNFYYELKRRHH